MVKHYRKGGAGLLVGALSNLESCSKSMGNGKKLPGWRTRLNVWSRMHGLHTKQGRGGKQQGGFAACRWERERRPGNMGATGHFLPRTRAACRTARDHEQYRKFSRQPRENGMMHWSDIGKVKSPSQATGDSATLTGALLGQANVLALPVAYRGSAPAQPESCPTMPQPGR